MTHWTDAVHRQERVARISAATGLPPLHIRRAARDADDFRRLEELALRGHWPVDTRTEAVLIELAEWFRHSSQTTFPGDEGPTWELALLNLATTMLKLGIVLPDWLEKLLMEAD